MSVEKMQKRIESELYDAILLTGFENDKARLNLRYTTGYTGSFGAAVIGKDFRYFITDFRYRDQAALEASNFTFVELRGGIVKVLKEIIEKENIKILGFDKKIRYSEFEVYQTLGVELLSVGGFVESFRISKNEEEVARIKKACEITDQALRDVLPLVKPGVSEKSLEIELKKRMFDLGADNTWPRFIVASGARGAMPHGNASDKLIEEGDMVTFDIGCSYKGYYSDLTRTVAVGEPSKEMKAIYDIVYEAQKRTVEAAKAGMTGKELDTVSRDYITENGHGENFRHGTGHGLGLDVHEDPRVSYANLNPLELGACVTIEPGIYVSGLGGVRIEDDVLVTETGYEVLSKSAPKKIVEVEKLMSGKGMDVDKNLVK